MEEDTRKWVNEPRKAADGQIWYACDPYPTWFRWDIIDGKRTLVTPPREPKWADPDN